MKNTVIKGKVLSLSPIVHDEIMGVNYADEKEKGAVNPFRKMPFVVQNPESASYYATSIPVVSGNGIRGLGRSLLVDYSLDDVLHINFSKLYDRPETARRVSYMFMKGGLTPKGAKIVASQVGAYEKIKDALPWLGLLGGVYICHHFEGDGKIGILVPVTQETATLYEKDFPMTPEEKEKLIPLASLKREEVRYTRRAIAKNQSEFPNQEKKGTEDKEAAIYGKETLAAGTEFFSVNNCISDNEGVQLAFRAMFALLSQYGYIGGMSGRGHGQVIFTYEGLDPKTALKEYTDYLLTHKEDIITALKALPELLQSTLKDEDEPKEKKGRGKGRKTAAEGEADA